MVKRQSIRQPKLPFMGEKPWSNPVLRAELERYKVKYKDDQEELADNLRPIYETFLYELSPRERAVIASFGRAYGAELTSAEIATDTKIEAKTINALLSRLTAANILDRTSRGHYHLPDDGFFVYFAFHWDTNYSRWSQSYKSQKPDGLGTIINEYINEMKGQNRLKHHPTDLVA